MSSHPPWLVTASVVFVALLLFTGVVAATEWPTEGGDYHRSASFQGVLKVPLGLKWSYNMAGGISASMAVYQDEIYVGSWDGHLYAIDAMTGELIWRSYTGAQVLASPTVTEDLVLIGSIHNALQAFSRADGSIVWEFPTRDSVLTSPVVFQDTVVAGSDDGNIYALDVWTGELQWRYITGSAVVPSLCYYNDTVYAATQNGVVWALNATTGTFNNKIHLYSEVEHSPVAFPGVGLLVAAEDCIHALDFDNLDLMWKTCFEEKVSTDLAFSGQQIYFGTDDNVMRSVEVLFQRQQWESSEGANTVSAPLITSNAVIWGNINGSIIVMNPINGFLMWRLELGVILGTPPIAHNDTLYIGLQDGTVLALSFDYPPVTSTTTTAVPTTSQSWEFPPAPAHTELPATSALGVLFALLVAAVIITFRHRQL